MHCMSIEAMRFEAFQLNVTTPVDLGSQSVTLQLLQQDLILQRWKAGSEQNILQNTNWSLMVFKFVHICFYQVTLIFQQQGQIYKFSCTLVKNK